MKASGFHHLYLATDPHVLETSHVFKFKFLKPRLEEIGIECVKFVECWKLTVSRANVIEKLDARRTIRR